MTYDLSGPYGGWVTWFNSPIYDGGYRFPSTGGLVPSGGWRGQWLPECWCDGKQAGHRHRFLTAIFGPAARANSRTPLRSRANHGSLPMRPLLRKSPFTTIMANYYQTNLYHWDTSAQAAYIGITNANPLNNMFISYDDQRTCQCQGQLCPQPWTRRCDDLGTRPGPHNGQPDPLLQAVKQSLASPGQITIQQTGQDVTISFNSIAWVRIVSNGRMIWAAVSWNTLAVTNISGPGTPVQIVDTNPFSQPQRFYRVQSPP